MEAPCRRHRVESRGAPRVGGEANGGIRWRGPSAAGHAEREKTVVGVVMVGAAGLVVRRDRARRPRTVEQEGIKVRGYADATQKEQGDKGSQHPRSGRGAHEPEV